MSFQAKRELLLQISARYQAASHQQKTIILDEFIAATGYARKYAIRLLTRPAAPPVTVITRPRARGYGPAVQEALRVAWAAANGICGKRLVPFLPELVASLERHGHLHLTDEVRAGDQFEVRGPVGGHFTWRVQDGGPLLLLAGGSGLVPLIAMLRHRAAEHDSVDARLLVSSRGLPDILYRRELAGLAEGDGLVVHHTLTRAAPEGWEGFSRRIDAEMLKAVGPEPGERPRIYVCGPTAFVERAADLLVELGHPPAAIHAERFGPTGA